MYYHVSNYIYWLVVWNIFYFPIYWEFHHPNWRSPSFFRGVGIPPTSMYIYIYQLTLYPDTCGIWNPHGLVKPETWPNFIGQESLKLSRELPKLDDNVTSGALPGPALPEVEGVMGFDHQHGDIWRTDEWAIQHLRWGFDHHWMGILYTFMGLNGIKWDPCANGWFNYL